MEDKTRQENKKELNVLAIQCLLLRTEQGVGRERETDFTNLRLNSWKAVGGSGANKQQIGFMGV